MAPPMERRRYQRIIVPLSVEYHTHCPESGELLTGRGALRDISLSGSFFHVPPPVSFRKGQVLSLSIAAPMPSLDLYGSSHFQATGEVIRLEPPGPASPHYGVALNFLNGPSFLSP